MAGDNEFNERKEREERLKHIEYQLEEEQQLSKERQRKEKQKLDRAREKERKKEELKKENAINRRNAEATKKAERKKQQQEANEMMEKARQSKKPKAKAQVNKTSIDAKDISSAVLSAASAREVAKDNIETELYIDEQKTKEKDLPQDLVKKIKSEQERAIRQTEDEIKDVKEQDKLTKYSTTRYSTSNSSGNYNPLKNRTNLNVQRNNGGFGIDLRKGQPREVAKGSVTLSNEDSFNQLEDDNNNSDKNTEYIDSNNENIIDRDNLKQNLSGLNNSRNIDNRLNNKVNRNSNSIFYDNEEDGSYAKRKASSSSSNNSIFLGAGMATASGATRRAAGSLNSSRASSSGRNIAANGNDIDSQLSNRIVNNMGRTARAAGGAAKKTMGAAKTLKTAMKAKKFLALGPIIATAGLIIVVLILLIGVISFIMNMPGMVRDKIVDIWDTFWQSAKGLIEGQDKPSTTAIKNLAEYLEEMGYDLKYNGFVTELEKDEDGNIKDIESKYLAAYIAAEQRSYLIANENHNVKKIWEGITGLFDENTNWDEPWGTGMIVLERDLLEKVTDGLKWTSPILHSLIFVAENLVDYFFGDSNDRGAAVNDISALTARIIIKRDTKEMYVSKVDIIDMFNTGGYDVYRYSLKEWTEKYGTPTELFLTLHLATRAPEFAYNFATTYDTKVFMDIKELENVDITLVYAKTDQDNKIVLDDDGKPIMIPISEMTDAEIKAKGISDQALEEMRKIDNQKITAFTPYITKVMNHWYYQQIIYQGEYEDKKIDVYQIQNLSEGDEGYVRYYAYTRRDNADAEKIEADSETVELKGNSFFLTVYNLILDIVTTCMTGGGAGISGILENATEAALQEAYDKISNYAVDKISDKVMDVLPNELAGMLNVRDFLKSGLGSISNIEVTLKNMSDLVDFEKITSGFNLENLDLDVTKMWEQLNLQEELLNMDLGGLGSISDLQNVIADIDLGNLNEVFKNNFSDIVDLSNVNFDTLTNRLVGGFSSNAISSMQDTILKSCDELFSGLSEADFNKISGDLLGTMTKQITDETAMPIINGLTSSIEKTISGQFNTEILSGLQNEFSKQLTGGITYENLEKLAGIQGIDFNQIKDLNNQATNVTAALSGMENSIDNLSNQVNKLAKDITGMDTRVLQSVSNSISKVDNTISSLESEVKSAQSLITSLNLTNKDDILRKINLLEEKTNLLKVANNNLDLEQMNILQNEIDTYKKDINNIINTLDNVDEQTVKSIELQISKIDKGVTDVVNDITTLDSTKLESLKYRIAKLDKTGLVQLATDLTNLDVSANGVSELVTGYLDDMQILETSEINNIIQKINNQNLSTQDAINGLSKYLLNVDEKALANNLKEFNNTVNILTDVTNNFDINKVANIVNKVPGFDKLNLNNLASQISGLENATIEQLVGKVEELPKQIVQQVSDNLKETITNGIKDQISANLSDKLKGKMLSQGNFAANLKEAMTSGESQNLDMEAEDQTIEEPYSEYSTGFYVREIRYADYFQKAEPLRVLYSPRHWVKMFREDKYYILTNNGIEEDKINNEEYLEKYGKTIWEATNGNIESGIYAMLQGIQSTESQYLFRYFKELFNDMSWVFDSNWGFSTTIDPNAINPDTIGWIFKTVKVQEPIYTGQIAENGTKNIKFTLADVKSKIEREVQDATEKLELLEAIKDEDNLKGNTYIENYVNELIKPYIGDKQELPDSSSESSRDAEFYKYNYTRTLNVYDVQYDAEDATSIDDIKEMAEKWWTYTEFNVEIKFYKYEKQELQEVEKAEYEPYTWSADKIGILTPKSEDAVYGFEEGLDIVSPVDGVVVAKTDAKRNELGESVAQSVTIELRNTGDKNADGMRIILIGGDYSTLNVGSVVRKVTYEMDEDGNYIGEATQSVIGKTTKEPIKIMVLDKDQTPVNDVSEYIHPPYETYKPEVGDEDDERK